MTSIEKNYLQMICRSCHLNEQNSDGDKKILKGDIIGADGTSIGGVGKKQYMHLSSAGSEKGPPALNTLSGRQK